MINSIMLVTTIWFALIGVLTSRERHTIILLYSFNLIICASTLLICNLTQHYYPLSILTWSTITSAAMLVVWEDSGINGLIKLMFGGTLIGQIYVLVMVLM